MDAETKAEVAVALTVENDPVGLSEDGSIAVGHRPGDPKPFALLELCSFDFHIVGEGAPIAWRGREVTQEFLGGRVKEGSTIAAESLALRGMLREPFHRVGGQGGGGVEPTPDDQSKVAHDLEIRRGLTVNSHLDEPVHDAR